PDVIHSLGLNINWTNICLPVLRVRQELGSRHAVPWFYSSWGTDLSFYPSLSKENREDVEDVIRNCDYLATEHRHDWELAKQMGFQGRFVGFFTGFGGIEKQFAPSLDALCVPSSRRTILVKGRDIADGDPVGRAMTAMDALSLCRDVLKDYHIAIFSAQFSKAVAEKLTMLSATTDLKLHILPHISYKNLMEVYQSSRIFLALTVNDGIPGSLLEAMSAGAFPIHSDLDSIRELITDGENGFLVPPDDPTAVAQALRKALTDNAIIDKAAAINTEIVKKEFLDEIVQPRVVAAYREIAQSGPVNEKQNKPTRHGATIGRAFHPKLLPLLQKAIGLGDQRVFLLLEKAIDANNTRVFDLLDKAIQANNTRVFDLLDKAINANNRRIFDLLEKAIDANNDTVFDLLHKAMAWNNPTVFRLMDSRYGSIFGKLVLAFHGLIGR
ncbi:MAG TPA: glycosyltransferase family 4 protein, partial [Desulfomonilaceae bacterium]|nr:glycosyltransferase family 4 protein [Desulfomonilaceae bacterium]